MTGGPWYADLGAIAGAVVAIGVILRMVVWPGLRAIWAAIVAAPRIALTVEDLLTLVRSNVLVQLAELNTQFGVHKGEALARDVLISLHGDKITALETRVTTIETRLGNSAIIVAPVPSPSPDAVMQQHAAETQVEAAHLQKEVADQKARHPDA